MIRCAEIRPLLALHAGGDLQAAMAERVADHLGGCPGCAGELAEFKALITLARTIPERELHLAAAVRTRIAARAADEAAGSGAWWRPLVDRPVPVALRSALITGLAAVLVMVMALPIVLRGRPSGVSIGRPEAVSIETIRALEGGAVRLTWRDGEKRAYRVYKSRDPRGVLGSQAYDVEGNDWVDAEPDSERIVYYRVEAVARD